MPGDMSLSNGGVLLNLINRYSFAKYGFGFKVKCLDHCRIIAWVVARLYSFATSR